MKRKIIMGFLLFFVVFLLGVCFLVHRRKVNYTRCLEKLKKEVKLESVSFPTPCQMIDGAGLFVHIGAPTNRFYSADLVLNQSLLYVSDSNSNQFCRVVIEMRNATEDTNTYRIVEFDDYERRGLFYQRRRSSYGKSFCLPKNFKNEPYNGQYKATAFPDSFNVFTAVGRQQPTEAGYLYLFVFPPYSGITSDDTVALFKSPETFPYQRFDGTLIRAKVKSEDDDLLN